jgi:amino acid permease
LAQLVTTFMVLVLFFLLCGLNINQLAPSHSKLFYSLICVAALTPFTLLRPGHVWFTALFAIIASVVLVVVIIVLCATGAPHTAHTAPTTVSLASLSEAFGVILFGFGGHAILPNLAANLASPSPRRYRLAVLLSFPVCAAMYISSSVCAAITLGGSTSSESVLENFQGPIANFGIVAVTSHLLFAVVTIHIPIGQMMDHYTGAEDFSARQIAVRLVTMGLASLCVWLLEDYVFFIVAIVGATANNAMIFIFPPWFYISLVKPEERTWWEITKVSVVITIGVLGMVSCLYAVATSP